MRDLLPHPHPAMGLIRRYRDVRAVTEALCAGLAAEDQVVQTMPDVSPTKWHRAHTTWFFERFVLRELSPGYREFEPAYDHLFNSYYQTAGTPFERSRRGLLSRPTAAEVSDYRRHVDRAVEELLRAVSEHDTLRRDLQGRIELGVNHEQQHQELLLMDIKHVFAANPLNPVLTLSPTDQLPVGPAGYKRFDGGEAEIGHRGDGFCFDSETPRHAQRLLPFELADRLVTNSEYREFLRDGALKRPELWLADGWAGVQSGEYSTPLYWRKGDREFTLGGERDLDPHAPVVHVSFYEAEAYARWAGARLPLEAEWEVAAVADAEGTDRAAGAPGIACHEGEDIPSVHPTTAGFGCRRAGSGRSLRDLFGSVWQWTATPYGPYPGFKPLDGTLGEYNGKFMCSQLVLRGGSCATPRNHSRPSYRNFFYPHQRWQFAGIRLARSV